MAVQPDVIGDADGRAWGWSVKTSLESLRRGPIRTKKGVGSFSLTKKGPDPFIVYSYNNPLSRTAGKTDKSGGLLNLLYFLFFLRCLLSRDVFQHGLTIGGKGPIGFQLEVL